MDFGRRLQTRFGIGTISATFLKGLQSIKAFVDGITAAVIGALAGAVAIIAIRNITDIPTALIALTSIFILIYLKKIKEPYIILLAAITGLILKTFL